MGDGLLGKLVIFAAGGGAYYLWREHEDKKTKANPEDEIEDRLERRIRDMDMRDRDRERMLMERSDRY
jgi:hypothetical protein